MTIERNILLLGAAIVFAAFVAFSAPVTNLVTLTWDWSDTNTQGFVYVGSASGVYTDTNGVSTNVWQTLIPVSVTRYYAVTAVTPFGQESDFSQELMLQNIKPQMPILMRYTVQLSPVVKGFITVMLAWDWADANTNGIIYVGSASGVYTATHVISTNVFTTTIPQSTTRYFAVAAVNQFGLQSDFSQELMIQNIKPRAPVLMKYTVQLK